VRESAPASSASASIDRPPKKDAPNELDNGRVEDEDEEEGAPNGDDNGAKLSMVGVCEAASGFGEGKAGVDEDEAIVLSE
jgi:hypothetical protein